jgi:hypothetical protein
MVEPKLKPKTKPLMILAVPTKYGVEVGKPSNSGSQVS